MNTVLTTAPGRHDHPPQPSLEPAQRPVRRVGLFDRLALHVGLALITWSRRPHTIESRERRATRVEQQLAQLERERLSARLALLSLPPR